jgi:hypothetical protein
VSSGSDYGVSMAAASFLRKSGISDAVLDETTAAAQPRNVLAVSALCVVVATWLAIPFLWAANEWGELSQVEVLWLTALALGVVLSACGLLAIRTRGETALAITVFFASLVLPSLAGLYLWLVRTLFGPIGLD